jgi:methyl-accepting chemotaxis protein
MEVIADILLVAGALGAGFYCFILARRLTRFTDLENGVGGAVAVLSAQVDDLKKTLTSAQNSAGESSKSLQDLTERAEDVARRLELLVASMHDLPQSSTPPPQAQANGSEPVFVRHPRN